MLTVTIPCDDICYCIRILQIEFNKNNLCQTEESLLNDYKDFPKCKERRTRSHSALREKGAADAGPCLQRVKTPFYTQLTQN